MFKLKKLPDWYTDIKPFHLRNDVLITQCTKLIKSQQLEHSAFLEDERWLQDPDSRSWSVFQSKSYTSPPYQDISAMLPILRDDSKSTASIKHLITSH